MRPVPVGTGEATIRSCAQQVPSHRRSNDIGDRIGRADLVKMNLIDARPVYLGLGLAQAGENPFGKRFLTVRQPAVIDECHDMVQVPVDVLVLVLDPHLDCPKAFFLHFFRREAAAGQSQRLDRSAELGETHSGIDQRPSIISPLMPDRQSR